MNCGEYLVYINAACETVKQNGKIIYVVNRLSELYDHLWLLLASQWRDHISQRLQIREVVSEIVAAEVKVELERQKEKQE